MLYLDFDERIKYYNQWENGDGIYIWKCLQMKMRWKSCTNLTYFLYTLYASLSPSLGLFGA